MFCSTCRGKDSGCREGHSSRARAATQSRLSASLCLRLPKKSREASQTLPWEPISGRIVGTGR